MHSCATNSAAVIAMWKEKDVEERVVHYIESSPKDQLQPKHFTREYPKPGDEIDTRAPWVFFTGTEEPLPADAALIANPFECRRLEWRKDSRRLTFEFVERGFGKHNVIEIDSEQMGVDKSEITRETHFINDLNADSLDTVELVMEFEDEFELSIPDEEAEKIQTVGQAIDYIKEHQNK